MGATTICIWTAPKRTKQKVPFSFTGRMRSSVILLGALLGRNKKGSLGYPGGCVIGKRPIDMHLLVLESLGARIQEVAGQLSAECERMKGTEFSFPKRSVGATQQGILGAVLAKGEKRFWRTVPASRKSAGFVIIFVPWARRLQGTCNRANLRQWSGRPEGRQQLGAAWTGLWQEPISVRLPLQEVRSPYSCLLEGELDSFLEVYRKIGGQYSGIGGKLLVNGKNVHSPVAFLETGVYPGFPTDLQSPLMAVLATVEGTSLIREAIFNVRWHKAAPELVRMGADIRILGRDALIQGGKPLTGTFVRAQELRGGAALILAALVAAGTTVLEGYSFVRRGYEHICQDLEQLGAAVKRIQE